MARWSDIAVWVGPTPNQSGPMQEYRGLVLHVMQGTYAGSIAWGKNPDSNVSFHFATAKDGRCGQLVDTAVTAWTQVSGNGHWISVENEDYSGNPLSALQVEKVAQIYARGVREYGWPLQSTDSPTGRGLGWHGMGGTAWGGHFDCPGEPIKAQRTAILARAAQILGGGDDMIAHLWKDTAGQYWYVTGPMAMRQKATQQQVDTIRYYSTLGGGFTLVDLSGGTPISPATVSILGVDITGLDDIGTLELTPEQMAQVTAAAQAGAEAGAPTHDELVAAAEEGANLAEDS